MVDETYQYSSNSISLKQNKTIFTIVYALHSGVGERSLRSMYVATLTAMDERRGNISAAKLAVATHNGDAPMYVNSFLMTTVPRTDGEEKDHQRAFFGD